MTDKKIKICYVASVEMTVRFILFNILKFLKDEGYDVTIVCSDGEWIRNIEKEGIKFKSVRFKRSFFTPFFDLVTFTKLFFYFKKEKFDIVHTHTLKPEFYGQIAARLAGVPIIANTIHGFYFGEETSFLKREFVIFLEKIAGKFSDIIFAVSNLVIRGAIKERICRPDMIKYWGGGVNIDRFNPQRFSQDFILQKKKQLDINPQSKVVGIVARLVIEKGYLDLFEAFKIILAKFPNTVLLVIGQEEPEKKDGIKKNIVQRYGIGDKVMFLGERTDVDELYPLMDIFVLPTHREGIGAAILEASAMEKPVIVTNTGGCPEAVDDKKTGILVPLKSANKLAKEIIYFFKNPEIAQKMGKAGREKVLREFDERLIFGRIKKEYNRLIKEKIKQ
jgi:glycosyltransferase involved in cell wall biosynthesis